MLFHSQIFLLLFLPAALTAFYLSASHDRFRVWILIAASLVFYAYWDIRLLPLENADAVTLGDKMHW